MVGRQDGHEHVAFRFKLLWIANLKFLTGIERAFLEYILFGLTLRVVLRLALYFLCHGFGLFRLSRLQ